MNPLKLAKWPKWRNFDKSGHTDCDSRVLMNNFRASNDVMRSVLGKSGVEKLLALKYFCRPSQNESKFGGGTECAVKMIIK